MESTADKHAPALKSYVLALGLRQNDLAELWKMSRVQVGRIVNCISGFAPKHARAFCREYGFPEDDFSRLYTTPADPAFFAQHKIEWKGPLPDDYSTELAPVNRVRKIPVIGSVQAGVFSEALERRSSELYSVHYPVDDGYPPNLNRYALEVRGESMNRVFPEGSVVCVIDFSELGRRPETGDFVVVHRHDPYGPGVEATIKALQMRGDGSACLWPQSDDPAFQQPIVLPGTDLECDEHSWTPDVVIKSLVVGMIKTRLRATF